MAGQTITAGRDALGEFAPQFAQLNDDVLFGEVWSREEQLSPRDRSLITVTALMSGGILDFSLQYHLQKARENGVTGTEIAEALTHLAFYSGWPKAWAAFRMAKEIWTEGDGAPEDNLSDGVIFPRGDELPEPFRACFTGRAYLHMLVGGGNAWNCPIGNVTFEPGCRNHWHRHPGGQILLVTGGRGWYQEQGGEARPLRPGDVVTIPEQTRHWHGAARDSWFAHLSIETNAHKGPAEWLEPVDDEHYNQLK